MQPQLVGMQPHQQLLMSGAAHPPRSSLDSLPDTNGSTSSSSGSLMSSAASGVSSTPTPTPTTTTPSCSPNNNGGGAVLMQTSYAGHYTTMQQQPPLMTMSQQQQQLGGMQQQLVVPMDANNNNSGGAGSNTTTTSSGAPAVVDEHADALMPAVEMHPHAQQQPQLQQQQQQQQQHMQQQQQQHDASARSDVAAADNLQAEDEIQFMSHIDDQRSRFGLNRGDACEILALTLAEAHVGTCLVSSERIGELIAAKKREIAGETGKSEQDTTTTTTTTTAAELTAVSSNDKRYNYLRSLSYEELWLECANRLTNIIQQIIEFAKMVPSFMLMEQDDQIVLLKAGSFELCCLRISRYFDLETNKLLFGNGLIPMDLFIRASGK